MYVLLTNSNSLWSICSESVAFGWPRVEHYSGGLTLHTPDGGRPSSLCSGELRVWLKQLTLTPQPTHLLHPVAILKFHSFFILPLFGWPGATVNKTDPRNSIWSRGNVCLTFFECNEKFKFNHRHVMSSIVNFWGSFFLYLFVFWGVGIWWLVSGDFITSQQSFSEEKKIVFCRKNIFLFIIHLFGCNISATCWVIMYWQVAQNS